MIRFELNCAGLLKVEYVVVNLLHEFKIIFSLFEVASQRIFFSLQNHSPFLSLPPDLQKRSDPSTPQEEEIVKSVWEDT